MRRHHAGPELNQQSRADKSWSGGTRDAAGKEGGGLVEKRFREQQARTKSAAHGVVSTHWFRTDHRAAKRRNASNGKMARIQKQAPGPKQNEKHKHTPVLQRPRYLPHAPAGSAGNPKSAACGGQVLPPSACRPPFGPPPPPPGPPERARGCTRTRAGGREGVDAKTRFPLSADHAVCVAG